MANYKSKTNTTNTNGKGGKRPPRKPKKQEPQYSNKGEVAEEVSKTEKYPQRGHSSWYYRDPVLMNQVTSFSFNQFLGVDSIAPDGGYSSIEVPTMMRIFLNPSPGFNSIHDKGMNGINQAGIKIYTLLSSGNSKNTQYAPQDVTTLMLALGEVLSISENARRAMGIAFTYNKRNWTYPKNIIRELGFDADDLFRNLAAYRIRFNTVVNMINRIAFPAGVPYFDKCISLYKTVYTDSESPMAQTYAFIPYSTWLVDETTYSGGTILSTSIVNVTPDGYTTMSMYLDNLQAQIEAVLNSATFNYIYADVLRLYSESGLYTIPYLDEEYLIAPEYNPMILLTINNATILGIPSATTLDLTDGRTPRNDVYPEPNTNRLIYMPQLMQNLSGISANPDMAKESWLLNYPHSLGDPDVDQRLESIILAARLIYEKDSQNQDWLSGAALMDHYVVWISAYANDPTTQIMQWAASYVDDSVLTPATAVTFCSIMEKFDRAPRLLWVHSNGASSLAISGDLDYYTTIDYDYLDRTDKLSILGLFDVDVK